MSKTKSQLYLELNIAVVVAVLGLLDLGLRHVSAEDPVVVGHQVLGELAAATANVECKLKAGRTSCDRSMDGNKSRNQEQLCARIKTSQMAVVHSYGT